MNEPASNPTDSAALDAAIEKAKEVAADIKQAADDLAVANTVLETKLAEDVKVGEVAQALDHTDSVEKTLTKSAEALDEVNAALENASGGERS
jgi:transcription elongation GreA/GreB family factor